MQDVMFALRFGLAASLIVAFGTRGSAYADDGSSAPKVAYTLIINGQRHEILPDHPLVITGAFENPKVTLRVAKTRGFNAAGVAFQYPAYFTYEADTADSDVQTWTVSGNDVTVILFRFSGPVSPRDLTDSTADALEAKTTESETIKLELGGKEHVGVKAKMRFASQTLIQQTVELPTSGERSRILVIQEVRTEDEAEAAEVPATLKLIASSLVIQP